MATDRDEQERQQQELEEIRRSFAEMGARMGSLFEPAGPDQDEQPALPAPAAAPTMAPPERPRWWRVAPLVVLFLAGGLLGYFLPRDDSGDPGSSPPPPSATPATTRAQAAIPPPAPRTSVPEVCLETAEWADEVIARLNRNFRDDRLVQALREYTLASQACRKEASP